MSDEKKNIFQPVEIVQIGEVTATMTFSPDPDCRDFVAQRPDGQLVREVYEKGVSCFKKSAKDRDAIVELQTLAVQKEFDVLLVYMFDRLGRRDDETPFIVEWFVQNGIEVWSANWYTMAGPRSYASCPRASVRYSQRK